MKAFVTGSRAYGTPRSGGFMEMPSDLDLVVWVSPEDLETIREVTQDYLLGSGNETNLSIRFGILNLIAVSTPEDYSLWADGTEDLKERRPVTHSTAVRVFESMREARRLERENAEAQRRTLPVPISCKLIDLVRIPGTRPLWPADFEALISKLQEEPNEKTHWGVIADWLDENGEAELADAFRWVSKRPKVQLVEESAEDFRDSRSRWSFRYLPSAVLTHYYTWVSETETIPELVAALSVALSKAREDLI